MGVWGVVVFFVVVVVVVFVVVVVVFMLYLIEAVDVFNTRCTVRTPTKLFL